MRVILFCAFLIITSVLSDIMVLKALKRYFNASIGMLKCWIAQAFIVPTALIIGFLITYFMNQGFNTHFLMWLILIFFAITIPKLFLLLYDLIFVLPFRKFRNFGKFSFMIGAIISASILGVFLYGSLIGRKKIAIHSEVIYTDRLPAAFDSLKIVQISDFHLGSLTHDKEYVNQIVDRINNLRPDLIFFTGDLVNSVTSEAIPFEEILKRLHARYGIYSVLGNHDYGDYYQWKNDSMKIQNMELMYDFQNRIGWSLLNNENQIIRVDNDSIAILGVENWGEPPFNQHGDLKNTLLGTSPATFGILLSHNPVHWREEVIPDTDIFLTLSGHTHAMQIQFGSFSRSSWRYRDWSGLYREGEQYLYVNKGLGYVLFPFRIGADPEITQIELIRN